MQSQKEQIVRTICNSHCGGTCEMQVYVRGGKITRIESADMGPGHRMCLRGRSYRQRVYAPDRLLYPLKRTGERGSGEFARVSWDEALDIVASALKNAKAGYGNESILHFCSMCDPHTIHHVQAFHRLLCQFGGYTAPWGTISDEGLNFASGVTFGKRALTYTGQSGFYAGEKHFLKARLIIFWGWNPVTTEQGNPILRGLLGAKENGAKFVNVDPRFHDSAAVFTERWIPIRPGTDVAVLSAMAYVIIKENLQDQKFIDTYTSGFENYKDYIFGKKDGIPKTPAWASAISSIPEETIAELAKEFATTESAFIARGIAAGRTAYGEQFHRAAYVLDAITGNIPIGEEIPFFRELARLAVLKSPPNPVEAGKPARWNAIPYRGPSVNSSARVNVSSFADAILKGKAGGYHADYKFLWISNSNYLNQLAEINKMVEAVKTLDFFLVTEQFMTATARFADVVLPVCTFLERTDLCTFGTFGSYAVLNQVIEPLGESKSQLDICQALAPRLGITDYNDKTDKEWVRQMVADVARESDLPDYETLRHMGRYEVKNVKSDPSPGKHKPRKAKVLFPTPSGKTEIYSTLIEKMNHTGLPALPEHIDHWENLNDPLVEKYPLQLITPHLKRRAHSQFDNLPWLRELQSQSVQINSQDAQARDIEDGDMLRVYNDRGELRLPAHVTERIMPGVVAVQQGAWYTPDKNGVDLGGCANMLTRNVTSPGGAFTPNTALVQVEKEGG